MFPNSMAFEKKKIFKTLNLYQKLIGHFVVGCFLHGAFCNDFCDFSEFLS